MIDVDKRTFERGMHSDNDPHAQPMGTYRDAVNIGNGESGDIGVVSNKLGNTAVSLYYTDRHFTVGSIEDELNQKVYYLVMATAPPTGANYSDHFIAEYDIVNATTSFLIGEPDSPEGHALQFQNSIKAIDIYYSPYGTILYWTDGFTEPKKLHVNSLKNKNLFRGNYDYIESFGSVSLIKKGDVFYHAPAQGAEELKVNYYVATEDEPALPPVNYNDNSINDGWDVCQPGYLYALNSRSGVSIDDPVKSLSIWFTQRMNSPVDPPSASFTTNLSLETNRIKGFVYQFRYRYINFDGEQSDWSMCSNTPVPVDSSQSYNPAGIVNNPNANANNEILVKIPIPTLDNDIHGHVKEVEVAVRKGGSFFDMGDWKLAKTFDSIKDHIVGEDSYYTLHYNGWETLLPLDQSILNQNNSINPIIANSQEIIGENRIAFGGVTLGRDLDKFILSKNPPVVNQYRSENSISSLKYVCQGDTGSTSYDKSSRDGFYITIENQNNPDNGILLGELVTVSIKYKYRRHVRNGPVWKFYGGIRENAVKYSFVVDQSMIGATPQGTNDKVADYIINLINNTPPPEPSNEGGAGAAVKYHPFQLKAITPFEFHNVFYIAESTDIQPQFYVYDGANPPDYSVTGNVLTHPGQNWPLDFHQGGSIVRIDDQWYNIIDNTADTLTLDRAVPDDGYYYLIFNNLNEGLYSYSSFFYYKDFLESIDEFDVTIGGLIGDGTKTEKIGSTVKFGIAYADSLGRTSKVVTHNSLTHTILPPSLGGDLSPLFLSIDFVHDHPEWAKKMMVYRSSSSGIKNFIQFPVTRNNTISNGDLNADFVDPDDSNNNRDGYYYVVGRVNETNTGYTSELNDADYLYIYINALNGSSEKSFNNTVSGSILNYSYSSGDRIRFLYSIDQNTGVPDTYYYEDIEISSYNELYNYVSVPYNSLSGSLKSIFDDDDDAMKSTAARGFMVEIYTPDGSDDDIWVETGDVVDISSVDEDFTINISGQNSFLRSRGFHDSNEVNLYPIEDFNYSDTYNSKAWSWGRINYEDFNDSSESLATSEYYKPNLIMYSDSSIFGSDVLRFGTIRDTSFKEVNGEFGSVNLIYSHGDRLSIYQDDRVGTAYTGRYVSTDLQGESTISSGVSAPVISDIIYLSGNYGTVDPGSHSVNGNREYFLDAKRSVILRKSNDGLTVLNNKGLDKVIRSEILENRKSSDAFRRVWGAFDRRNNAYNVFISKGNEYRFDNYSIYYGSGEHPKPINYVPSPYSFDKFEADFGIDLDQIIPEISIPDGTVVQLDMMFYNPLNGAYNFAKGVGRVSGNYVGIDYPPIHGELVEVKLFVDSGRVLVFSERLIGADETMGAFTSWISLTPDLVGECENGLCSWKNGQMFLHETKSSEPGLFFGSRFNSEIEVVSNKNPTNSKLPKNIAIYSDTSMGENAWSTTTDGVETSLGQFSEMTDSSDFSWQEGVTYANFLRDKNTPNKTLPLIDGDFLRGEWTKIRLKIDNTIGSHIKLFAVAVRSVISRFSQ